MYGDRHPTKGQYAPVIGLFVRQIQEGNKMTVVGDGLQTRDYTNVSDVVDINIAAAVTPSKEVCGEIINVGTGTNHSVLDIVELLKPGYFEFIPARPGEARETLADISKAKRLLNYNPKIKLEDWIANHKKEVNL